MSISYIVCYGLLPLEKDNPYGTVHRASFLSGHLPAHRVKPSGSNARTGKPASHQDRR